MNNTKPRISLDDSLVAMVYKLSEDNPGALTALGCMVGIAESVDPDTAFGFYTPLIGLDAFGIYGSRIWMLFKDCCKEDPKLTLACLRAVQLGILSDDTLDHAIDHGGEGLNPEAVLMLVQERLPKYGI
jgi:hypothetical protein